MTTLTVADFADTGQWRLILNIHPTGINALLENTLHKDVEPQRLFATRWDNDPDNLLHHIENAVYDNPRVLDDFSARIVLFDRRTLFIPTVVIEENESEAEEIYTSLYTAKEADVVCETEGDLTAASSLAPGLKGFLQRTFPGARIATNLMMQVTQLRKENSGSGKRMTVTVRDEDKEADFILLDGVSLVSASTHTVNGLEDITYHIYNIIDTYGLDPSEVEIPEKYRC